MEADLGRFDIPPEPCSRPPGEIIGPYRILRALGSGGMGEVYLCERADDQYHQQVAIKLVNRGLMSKQVYNRLRTERQILASLDHPNIARLLDGGSTADGTPYLVLEYIQGEPIDLYCDRLRLSIPQRLHLFRVICSAVHAAHRSLVVHRDLKPSNILVTPEGVPKLLDFGIAKLLEADRMGAHTVAITQADIRVMTPDHASPEQIRGEPITTASDVYVLGVLLYQLLCGRRPFEVAGLRMSQVERLICETGAPMPSQRLREPGERAAIESIAAQRAVTPARLVRQLTGDLDNIVSKAMRKEPDRRYGSVEQLSADIERYLTGMPVIARRDTWSYRTRKFLVRHPFGAATAAAFLVLLTGFAASMYVQAERVRRERDLAAAQRVRAELERGRAERVSEFLVDIFRRSDPGEARGAEVSAREILERGAARVEAELKQEPQTQATLMDAIGRVYLGLGLPERAQPLLERALALRREVYGEKAAATATGMRSLALAHLERGELAAAEALLREALAVHGAGGESTAAEAARTEHALATVLLRRGELEAAASFYRLAIDRLIALHGEHHTEVTSVLNELAVVMLSRGEYAEAERLYRRSLVIDRELLGRDHPQVMHQIGSLALALQMQDKLAEAEPLFLESLVIAERVLGPRHPDTIRVRDNYGYFLQVKGENEAAERIAREVLELDRQVRGERHYYVGYDAASLAGLLYDRGRFREAEALYREALGIYRASLPAEHQYVAAALTGLARVHAERGERPQVKSLIEHADAIWRRELPQDGWQVANTLLVLGRCAAREGRYAEAESLLLDNHKVLARQLGANNPNTRRARRWLAELYLAWGQPVRAAEYR